MTITATTNALVEARRRHARAKRAHVRETVDSMVVGGTEVTFTAVARAAGVSKWLVYADGIKEYIEKAQAEQSARPADEQRSGMRASAHRVPADLQLALQKNTELRSEVKRLTQTLRERLGEELVGESAHRLQSRIADLRDVNTRLVIERDSAVADRDDVRRRLEATEDDLAAARRSLRQTLIFQPGVGDRCVVTRKCPSHKGK